MKTVKHAKTEFEILKSKQPNSLIIPFEPELLAIVERFSEMGNSGGSTPFVIQSITHSLTRLLEHKTLTNLTGVEREWSLVSVINESILYQNVRDGRFFKTEDESYCIDAIIWVAEDHQFTGTVYSKDGLNSFSSHANTLFPIMHESFYIKVDKWYFDKKVIELLGLAHAEDDKGLYTYVLSDEKDLELVKAHYKTELCS